MVVRLGNDNGLGGTPAENREGKNDYQRADSI